MSSKIQIKRGTTEAWASSSNDTTLAPGQLGVEYLTSGYSRLKVGTDNSAHSSTDWAELNYLTPSTQTYQDNMISNGSVSVVSWPGEVIQFGNTSKATQLIGGAAITLRTNTTGNIVASNNSFFSSASDVSLGQATTPWLRLFLGNATSSDISQDANGLYFGTGRYPSITRYSSNLIFNPSGGLSTAGRLTLSTAALYPSANGGCDLGTASYGWDNLFMSDQSYIMSGSKYIAYDAGTDLYIGANGTNVANFYDIQLMGKISVTLRAIETDVGVSLDASQINTSFHPVIGSKVSSLNLGSSTVGLRWGVVYCQSVSESSDVSLKSDIHYLDPPQVNLLSTADVQEEQYITVEDVLEFISELKPATFVYKSKNISTVADAEELDMEAIHLGIIANDIEDSKLFEYVASKHETTTTLEDGTTKVDKNLSIKPASLAVAALTACKYLINQVKELKEMLSNSNN